MKKLDSFKFDPKEYKKELKEFENLLISHTSLDEGKDILPFFRRNRHLSSQLATVVSEIVGVDEIAFEYDIFGDFRCDFIAGDKQKNTYCFVEFEDANRDSIFVTIPTKYKPEFSKRFEHGYSQIIDWFHKLEDLQNTDSMEERFGNKKISYEAVLIIGRSSFLNSSDKNRLDWRMKHVIVNSKRIYCYTFDEIYDTLNRKLALLELTFK